MCVAKVKALMGILNRNTNKLSAAQQRKIEISDQEFAVFNFTPFRVQVEGSNPDRGQPEPILEEIKDF